MQRFVRDNATLNINIYNNNNNNNNNQTAAAGTIDVLKLFPTYFAFM